MWLDKFDDVPNNDGNDNENNSRKGDDSNKGLRVHNAPGDDVSFS